jgi:hypothetical protein
LVAASGRRNAAKTLVNPQIQGDISANTIPSRNHLQRFSLLWTQELRGNGDFRSRYFSFEYVWTEQIISAKMFYPQEIKVFSIRAAAKSRVKIAWGNVVSLE